MTLFPLTRPPFMRHALPLLLCALLSGPARAGEKSLVVFAAVSTSATLTELKPELERATGRSVVFNFAGSGELARQLKAKPIADLFLCADQPQMQKLLDAKIVASAEPLLSNSLVVVVAASATQAPVDAAALAKVKHLALGDPSSVPVGTYAKQWLTHEGVWREMEARVVPMLDARAVLAAVATGRISAGVVYATDARDSKDVKLAFAAREETQPKIIYPVAALTPAGHTALEVLRSAKAREVFERHGFIFIAR